MSKKATWVAGTTRSKQYYGLRTDYSWLLSGKTREPVDAMKEAWGDELDVVTMLALEVKPVERGWERFRETREIVDLGRNERDARRTINQLGAQARDELHLLGRAEEDHVNNVRARVKSTVLDVRHRIARKIESDGLWSTMTDYQFNSWVTSSLYYSVLGSRDVDKMEVEVICQWLDDGLAALTDMVLSHGPTGHYIGDITAAMCRQYAASAVRNEIRDWRSELENVRAARAEIAEREKLLETQLKLDAINALDYA